MEPLSGPWRIRAGRAPLVLPALGAISGLAAVEVSLLFLIPAAICLILTFLLQGRKAGGTALLLTLLLSGIHLYKRDQTEAGRVWMEKRGPLLFAGTVQSVSARSLILSGHPVTGDPAPGRVNIQVNLPPDTPAEPGKRYLVEGKAHPCRPPLNPGEYDRVASLRQRGLSAVMEPYSMRPIEGTSVREWILTASHRVNRALSDRLGRGFEPDDPRTGVLRSLVLGARDQAAPETVETFRQSGLLHIFAVSGLHVGLVALMVAPLLLLCGLRPRAFALSLVILLCLYDFATGLSVSANRATLMLSVLLLCPAFGLRSVLANRIALAALLLLLWDTRSLFQWSFLLSFGAVIAVVAAIHSASLFFPLVRPDDYIPASLYTRREKIVKKAGESLICALFLSCAAWLATSLLLIPGLHYVTPFAPLANILLSVPITLLMGGGLLRLLTVNIPLLDTFVAAAVKHLSGLLLATAQYFSQLPGAVVPVPPPPSPGSVTILSLYGQHYAARLGNPAVLLEAGSEPAARHLILPALRAEGCIPGLLAVSHLHKAQSGGVSELKKHLPAIRLLSPGAPGLPHQGAVLKNTSGGAFILLLNPAGITPPQKGTGDDLSLIYLWEYGGKRVLFLGDAGWRTEQKLQTLYPGLRADVVVLGAHQTDYSGTVPFLTGLRPSLIVHTSPDARTTLHRPASWTEELRAKGITLWNLERQGAIRLNLDASPLHHEEAR